MERALLSGRTTGAPRLYWRVGTLFWIVYLLFDLPRVLQESSSGPRVATHLGLLALIVLAYVYVVLRPPGDLPLPGRRVVIAVMAAAVTAVVLLGFPGQWATLFVFVALAVAVVYTAGQAVRGILLAAAAAVALSVGHGLPASMVLLAGIQTAIAGLGLLSFLHILRLNIQLREAREDLARMAVAEERVRFARDLHDLLGHSLSVIALKSELAGELVATDPAGAATEMREVEQVARRSLAEVREAVGGYRQVALAAELVGARAALDAAGVRVTVDDPPRNLPGPVEAVLGWAVREGATNVLRHSGAASAHVRFERDDGRVAVEITDDGPGGGEPGTRGSGLAGLAERVAAGGGRLKAGQLPEGGYRLRVELPSQGPGP
jgi:two-component system sensor histidine kinase DesK